MAENTKKHGSTPPFENEARIGSAVITSEKIAEVAVGEHVKLNRSVPIDTKNSPYRISAHACTWRFKMEGKPQRTPDKKVKMRGWVALYWYFKGCTIQANIKTLFISVKTRKKANTRQAIYGAWNKVDKLRREFSEWQRIGIMPYDSPHPSGADKAHVVFESPNLKTPLNTQAFKPSSQKIGLIHDKSHNNKPEMTGEYSIEGGIGADWVFLNFPNIYKEKCVLDNQKWRELEASIGLLRSENAKLAEAISVIMQHLALKK